MHPDDFQDMTDLGVFWQRSHPSPFIWGENDMPEEIEGQVKMTNASGSETVLDAVDIVSSNSPVFIEII